MEGPAASHGDQPVTVDRNPGGGMRANTTTATMPPAANTATGADSKSHSHRMHYLPKYWLPVVLTCLIGIPLYALLISVIVRSDLLDFEGKPFSDEQFKALIAFFGVALGTTATALGVFLTKASNDRAQAQQAASLRQAERAEQESEARQKLDTAVQVLGLMKFESGYAAKAVTGGALTTLVHLGHPVIAMRTLQAALADEAVDISTAVWLIDQVLSGDHTVGDRSDLAVSKQDAAELLLSLVDQLPDDARPGYAAWPSCISGRWPPDLDVQTGMNLVFAMLSTLTSRPESWWTSRDLTWLWTIDTLVGAAEDISGHQHLREESATYATVLLGAIDLEAVDQEYVQDVNQRMSSLAHPDYLSNAGMELRVDAWIAEANSRREPPDSEAP